MQSQHLRRPRRALERTAPPQGDLRLAGVRHRRRRDRQLRRYQDAGRRPGQHGRRRPRRSHRLRPLPQVRDRVGADSGRARPGPALARGTRGRRPASSPPSAVRRASSASSRRTTPTTPGQISEDGRSVLVQFEVRGGETLQEKRIDPIEKRRRRRRRAQPERVRIGEFGGASANKAISKAFSDDFAQGREALAADHDRRSSSSRSARWPRRASRAAGALGCVRDARADRAAEPVRCPSTTRSARSSCWSAWPSASTTRCSTCAASARSAAWASPEAALEVAAATSGRAVLVSGFTVMAAMAGMFLAGDRTFAPLGIATIMVVAIAMIGSITVVPAAPVQARRQDRQGPGPVPAAGCGATDGDSRAWGWVIDKVLARPVVSVVLAGGLLVALAMPAFWMHTADTGTDGLPAVDPDHAGLRPHAGGLPGQPDPGERRHPGRRRHVDPDDRGDPRPALRRRRHRPALRAGQRRRSAPTTRSHRRSTDRRQRAPTPVDPGARRRCATRSSRPPSASCPTTHGLRHRPHRGVEGLQRPDEGAARRSCSRSSWRWPSCCCWSPSARSSSRSRRSC